MERARSDGGTSALLSGATTLGVAAVVSKLLGTLQKIPLQNLAGDEAFGIYNAVYPLYTLVLFLATAGFPVAVSSFVSERMAAGKREEATKVLGLSASLLFVLGLLAFALLFWGAEHIAHLVGNERVTPALHSVSFAFLFVPVMAALRGYFQGRMNMVPTGVSQVGEQVVRVATMIALLLWLVGRGASDDIVAAGATFGSVTGAAAGLAIMVAFYLRAHVRERPAAVRRAAPDVRTQLRASNWVLLRQLAAFALPVCLGAIVVPVLNIVDTFTLPRLLEQQGLTETAAMREFGVYSRGLPLVQLVAMLFSSVSVALVPALTEAKANHAWQTIRQRTHFSLRFTWMIGLAASFGLAVAALPINVMLYTNTRGTLTMAILAFTAVFSVINIVSASLLQGLGRAHTPALNLLVAAVVKVALNAWWVPVWGVNGAAAAAVVAFWVAAMLNIMALIRAASIRLHLRDFWLRPLLPLALMLLVVQGLHSALAYGIGTFAPLTRTAYSIIALVCVTGGAVTYLFGLFRFGVVTADDLRPFPQLRRRLSWLVRE